MTAYTGTVLATTGFGRQDERASVICSVAWTSALSTSDTLTISNAFPPGVKLLIEEVTLFGTQPDTNASQTFGFKLGTENDDDAFQAAVVIDNPNGQLVHHCVTGIGTTIDDDEDIVLTPSANPATGATSGTFYIKVIARPQMK